MKLYREEDILSAIECCNIHKVEFVPSPTIDGMFDKFFETIEPRKFLQLLDRFHHINEKKNINDNDYLVEYVSKLSLNDVLKLEKYSKEYGDSLDVDSNIRLERMKGFVAGVTSKYVEIESLIERISFCEDILRYCNLNEKDENMIEESIIRFEQKINEK